APLPPRSPHRAWGQTTRPPERSQGWLGPPLASRTCSPTSLGMALALQGCKATTLEVARGVYDKGGDLYGNWSFNVAYAGSRGLRAVARHLTGWRAVEDEIAAGRAVVISHRYKKGQLEGGAVSATVGHLIVLVGFTETGDVVVHDPAGNTRQGRPIRRVYKRDQLWNTWQRNHEGVAYLVQPDELVAK
ncbi:MAG: C39 family peptidase, partial [Planctomycetes bacterium]|nr:C39 family peptidase [Planctomycetota bacterium]